MLTANQPRVSIHANDAYLIIVAYSRLNPLCLPPPPGLARYWAVKIFSSLNRPQS